MPLKLSISIVVYDTDFTVLEKTLLHLQEAVAYLQDKQMTVVTIYLIDNSRASHYVDFVIHYPHLQLIKNPLNRGYGYGNNLAIHITDSGYHLVLNPDAFLNPDALFNAIAYLQAHPKIALLAPSIQGLDGERHYNCKNNPTLFDHFLRQLAPAFLKRRFAKRMREFENYDHDYNQPLLNVSGIAGCAMLFKTAVLKQVGGFDTRYFLYFEDDDITRKILQHAQTAYLPEFKLIHQRARRTHSSIKHQWYFISSLVKYCWKWREK